MNDKVDRKTFLSKFGTAVVNMLIGFFRWIIDNTIHGIFRVINSGSKDRIPKVDNDLLLEPAVQLAAKIRRGELSSETLVRAYIERIVEVDDYLNAVVDSRFADALEEARQVDQLVRSGTLSEKQMAENLPLLGIPFTTKEALVVKGLSNTGGMVSRKGSKAEKDCEAVQKMKSCGAIPVAVTIIPELCLWWESYNNIHGRTKNAYDTRRTPGGSSGGEGALIASAASMIGLSSDLGGSMRLPAFFNGIFGHKPSQNIVPDGGKYPTVSEELRQYCVVGPMTRYAADLKLVLSALIGKEETQRLKLLDPVDVKSIKVYYMLDNGGDPATTPVSLDIQNGIKKVANMLLKDGFTVKKVDLKCLQDSMNIWISFILTIKDVKVPTLVQGEARTEKVNFAPSKMCKCMFGKSNHAVTPILLALMQDVIGLLCPNLLNSYKECGMKMKQEFLELLEPEPAVFLYPTYPEVAPYLGQVMFNIFNLGYSAIFNIARLPVTQCPLGLDSSGLPFGMQIITAPNNDRHSIALAEYLEEKIGGWIQPSSSSE